jgi:hypothetical protein
MYLIFVVSIIVNFLLFLTCVLIKSVILLNFKSVLGPTKKAQNQGIIRGPKNDHF